MENQDELTIVLKKPIKLGDITYESLTLRELTLDETDRAMRMDSKLSMLALMISCAAGIPLLVAKQMKISDSLKADKFLSAFTPDSPATGEAESLT
jgi:hypothetical protein